MFRDLGPDRTLSRTARELGLKSVAPYSTQHDWLDRAEAYDGWVDQRTQEQRTDEILEMRDRHAHIARRCQDAAMAELAAYEAKIRAADSEIETARREGDLWTVREPILSMLDLIRLAKVGFELERASRGQEGDLEQAASELDTSQLSVEELREFHRLMSKLQ